MLLSRLKRLRWEGRWWGRHNESTISAFHGWVGGELAHGTLILLLISLLFFKSSFFGFSLGVLLGLERDTSSSIVSNHIQMITRMFIKFPS